MQDHRVDRAPDVVDSGVADDIDSAGFRIARYRVSCMSGG